MSAPRNAFAKGLLAGFAGNTTFKKIQRGEFSMLSSTYKKDGVFYIDQWFPGHLGGGQEILEVDRKRFTRVYAGGTLEDKALSHLGITKDDVMAFLKKSLQALGVKTRFDEPADLKDGDWTYQYVVIDRDEVTGVVTGKETIVYMDKPVFVHLFVISSVTA